MPIIRGYAFFGRGDVLSHLGHINDILAYGYIVNNMYAPDHLLAVTTFMISGISINKIMMILPSLFSILYIYFIYLLALKLFEEKRAALIILAIGSTIFLNNQFMPSIQASVLFVFILYLFFRKNSWMNNLLLIVTMFSIVFFHPLIAFLMIIYFFFVTISVELKTKFSPLSPKIITKDTNRLAVIGIIAFFIWQSYAYLLVHSLTKIAGFMSNEAMKSDFQAASQAIGSLNPDYLDIINTIIYTYGTSLLLFIAVCLTGTFILKNLSIFEKYIRYEHILFFLLSMSLSMFAIVFFIAPHSFGFSRILALSVFPSTISLALFIQLILKISGITRVRYLLVLLTLLSLTYISTFCLYNSENNLFPNAQVTDSEFKGVNFVFDKLNANITIFELGLTKDRFWDAIHGFSRPRNIKESDLPPDHFGYDNENKSGLKTHYLLINEIGRELYPRIYPKYIKQWRFTAKDFELLEKDIYVEKNYDNNNIAIYFFH